MRLGYGYAAPAVADGRVFILDYDQAAKADVLRCLALDNGSEIWRRAYSVSCKFNHGMSRTVPAVAEGVVVSLGPRCHVVCCDAASGDFRWGLDLVRDYGTKEPPWYAGQCPLIDQGHAIIAPAGPDVLLMAVDLKTGQPKWKSPNPRGWKMTHASVLVATIAGQRMYVYPGSGGVAAVSADDGRLLWETDAWKVNIATVPTPLQVDPERIFCCGGYGSGAAMLKIARNGEAFTASVEWRCAPGQFGSDQQTPILSGGLIYGVVPDGQLVCLGLDGKRRWASGVANRFGLGPYLIADGKVLLVNDTGTLTMAAASPDGWKLFAQAKVLNGHDAWGPLALAGSRLLARDLDSMVCLDLAPTPTEAKP
jgi:outer membrane protein assembly factor BamB